MSPWRSKIAAVVVLFFLGTFAGQLHHLLDVVRGKVDAGSRITAELRETVTTIGQAGADLRAQIADLQAKLAAGTATPAQVADLQALVGRLKTVAGPAGAPGPVGPKGATGPAGPPATSAPGATSTTAAPASTTTTTTRAPTTTTTRRPGSTTTTTRCAVALPGVVRLGC